MAKKHGMTWYIEYQGNRKGPYTLEEIQTKFSAGEIQESTRVYPGEKDVSGITLQDIMKQNTDPLYSLFDTLQVARSRTSPLAKRDSPPESPPKMTRRIGVVGILTLLLLLCAVFWILYALAKRGAPAIAPTLVPQQPNFTPEAPIFPPPQNGINTPQNIPPPAPNQPTPPPMDTPTPPPTSEELREPDPNEPPPPPPESFPPEEPRYDPLPDEPPPVPENN